jgi:hypothetical protein
MDKIEQARKRAKEQEKAFQELEEKRSKLGPEEKQALAEYESDMLISGVMSSLRGSA